MTPAMVRRVTVYAAVFVFLGLARNAQALPVFSCGSGCNGATYAVDLSDAVGPDYVLDFWIDTTGYDGAESDFIKAIAVKNFVADFGDITAMALVDAPGGVANWDFINQELNGKGCEGGNTSNFCAQADITFNGGKGYNFTIGDLLKWQFTFTYPGSVFTTAHIKYLYVDEDGKKEGSLGSWDIPVTGCVDDCDVTPVPEPATMALFSLGLVAIGARRFRRRR